MSKSDSFKFSVLLADPERSTLAQHALPFLRGELHAEKSEGMDVDIGRLDATPSLVSFSDGHPRLQIRTDGGGEFARFDVSPESLKAAENCRVRVALAVERGRIALGIKTQDSRLLTSEPVAMQPGRFRKTTEMDFSVPLNAIPTADGKMVLTLSSVDPGLVDVSVKHISVHDCVR